MLNIFIGWDAREDEAFRVCRHSLDARTSQALRVEAIKHRQMRQLGLFDRPWTVDGETGQMRDVRDGKPFSTEFSHSRFLVPHYARYLGLTEGWALFCDCDFLFQSDIASLFALADPHYAVMVVKHMHKPDETSKMDGQMQTVYPRKNWSSLILWNLAHPAHGRLGVAQVNMERGRWLHAFGWLDDDDIGELPRGWNHLVGVDPLSEAGEAGALHYTLGGPWFEGHEAGPLAARWLAERRAMRDGPVLMNRPYA